MQSAVGLLREGRMQGEVDEAWMDGWMQESFSFLSFIFFLFLSFFFFCSSGPCSQQAIAESTECLHIYGSLR